MTGRRFSTMRLPTSERPDCWIGRAAFQRFLDTGAHVRVDKPRGTLGRQISAHPPNGGMEITSRGFARLRLSARPLTTLMRSASSQAASTIRAPDHGDMGHQSAIASA